MSCIMQPLHCREGLFESYHSWYDGSALCSSPCMWRHSCIFTFVNIPGVMSSYVVVQMLCEPCTIKKDGGATCSICHRGMTNYEISFKTGNCNRCFNQEKYKISCTSCGLGILNPEWNHAKTTGLCDRCHNAESGEKQKCTSCYLGLLTHEARDMDYGIDVEEDVPGDEAMTEVDKTSAVPSDNELASETSNP